MRHRLSTAATTPQPPGPDAASLRAAVSRRRNSASPGDTHGTSDGHPAPPPCAPPARPSAVPAGAPPARRPAREAMKPGHYRFRHVARMEWIKLRSLRSTWWTLGITVCGATAMAVVIGSNTRNAGGDLTNNALAGVVPGLLLTGVLGVLTMTSEYTSGMIRATLAAVPGRGVVLAAKAAVFGVVALGAGEAGAFISFAAGGAALRHGIAGSAGAGPAVFHAGAPSGAKFSLSALLVPGVSATVRNTAAAIAV